jgi:hypothetical protein
MSILHWSCSAGPPLAAVVLDSEVGGPEHPLMPAGVEAAIVDALPAEIQLVEWPLRSLWDGGGESWCG